MPLSRDADMPTSPARTGRDRPLRSRRIWIRSPVRFPARSSSIGHLGVVSSPTGSLCAVTLGLPESMTPASPVTRTLRILADEGLVRVVPRWGTFRA